MKISNLIRFSALSLGLLTTTAAFSQAGYSTGSMAYQKQTYGLDSSHIFVEEIFNYRRHDIPVPTVEEKVNLDLRTGATTTTKEGSSLFQLGITTARIEKSELTPTNLVIVVDRSGSMDGDRMFHANDAVKTLVNQLRPEDKISVVLFDNSVDVIIPSQPVQNPGSLNAIIDSLAFARGGTDLNSGLVEGYQQAVKSYNSQAVNKVILLTDAIANLGQTSPTQILKNMGVYQQQMQIDFTLIGLGADFNNDLARTLTEGNNSSIHFIADPKDIKKVFVDELESMLSPVGRDVKLVLEWDTNLKLEHFYGYQAHAKNNTIELKLNNMNSGLTQIALAKFKLLSGSKGVVKAKLFWKDAITQQPLSLEKSITIQKGNTKDWLTDEEVRKNYTIAQMAQALYDGAIAFQDTRTKDAIQLIEQSLDFTKKQYPTLDDDLQLVCGILERHLTNLNMIKP